MGSLLWKRKRNTTKWKIIIFIPRSYILTNNIIITLIRLMINNTNNNNNYYYYYYHWATYLFVGKKMLETPNEWSQCLFKILIREYTVPLKCKLPSSRATWIALCATGIMRYRNALQESRSALQESTGNLPLSGTVHIPVTVHTVSLAFFLAVLDHSWLNPSLGPCAYFLLYWSLLTQLD